MADTYIVCKVCQVPVTMLYKYWFSPRKKPFEISIIFICTAGEETKAEGLKNPPPSQVHRVTPREVPEQKLPGSKGGVLSYLVLLPWRWWGSIHLLFLWVLLTPFKGEISPAPTMSLSDLWMHDFILGLDIFPTSRPWGIIRCQFSCYIASLKFWPYLELGNTI